MDKTNPMRILDRAGIDYSVRDYTGTGAVAGADVASVLGEDPGTCFKTLVTQGMSGRHYVFAVPVSGELDLKKAAASVGEKSVGMIRSKDLLPVTGYVHGGCSPLGMRRRFTTVFHGTAGSLSRIFISGGRIGIQIELRPGDLSKVLDYTLADIIR